MVLHHFFAFFTIFTKFSPVNRSLSPRFPHVFGVRHVSFRLLRRQHLLGAQAPQLPLRLDAQALGLAQHRLFHKEIIFNNGGKMV